MELVKPVEPVLWACNVELVMGGTGYGTVEALFFRPTKWSELSNQPNENRENVKMAREERGNASSNKSADIT